MADLGKTDDHAYLPFCTGSLSIQTDALIFLLNRYCAELVAACLQVGGLMSPNSETGSATPSSLYKLYKNCGAVAANPCTLRRQFAGVSGTEAAIRMNLLGLKSGAYKNKSTGGSGGAYAPLSQHVAPIQQHPPRHSSPPRMSFKQLSSASRPPSNHARGGLDGNVRLIGLTLASLDMNRR